MGKSREFSKEATQVTGHTTLSCSFDGIKYYVSSSASFRNWMVTIRVWTRSQVFCLLVRAHPNFLPMCDTPTYTFLPHCTCQESKGIHLLLWILSLWCYHRDNTTLMPSVGQGVISGSPNISIYITRNKEVGFTLHTGETRGLVKLWRAFDLQIYVM